MTTADYLESLQDDLSRTVEALDLEEGTNFTDIANMAENGDISTGGGSSSEYYYDGTTSTFSNTNYAGGWIEIVKKIPPFSLPNMRKRENLFYGFMGEEIELGDSIVRTGYSENITAMFKNCINLKRVNFEKLNIPNLTYMDNMFEGCTAIERIDLSVLAPTNINNFKTFTSVFSGCTSLQYLDLSGLDTSNVTSMSQAFRNCKALTYLDIRKFNFDRVTGYNNMFGASATDGPPDNCLIIVADQTAKSWLNTNFSRLTNVQTVEEYEGN